MRKGKPAHYLCGGRSKLILCGSQGYDAVYIASHLSYKTVGIDLSPFAVEAAKEYAYTET